ncbi:MAG TPA: MarR family transcriptional regulator [Rhizomicrobium sp.]|nr:MarR family transcriptional regulator [Rhizomicrobium sp.]
MAQSFDRDLLILLHDVARTLRTRFDQKARASHAMTRAQWIILSRLDRQPGMSQNELAAICEVEPITVARLVDRLEARGLVERRSDPADRRIRRLHLLPAAKPILETINSARETMNARIVAGLDEKTRETLIDGLLVIKENLANEALTSSDELAEAGE